MIDSALLTDLYQLTMAEAYARSGKAQAKACFYMSFRELPFAGGYAIACGMERLARYIEGFSFSNQDVAYLMSLTAADGSPMFSESFLATLTDLRLTVNIDAVPEGTAVFPHEPLLRVIGSITQCQLIETALLNAINYETLIATKAARIVSVASGPVAEFGLRRAQGPAGGVYASRAAFVGGCSSTSNVLAGQLFGLPVSGTHAHSWVMAFSSELEAFRAYAAAFPQNCTLLVDTYDVIEGVRNAIIVAQEMANRGERLAAIRIDSGDLAWLSKRARELLDSAGFTEVQIVASNDLDEYTINSLLHEQDAAIDIWGVGTKLACAYDQPSLGGVYKMSALREPTDIAWQPRLKLSAQTRKSTLPGLLQTRRFYNEAGIMIGDMIYSQDDGGQSLIECRIVDPLDTLRQKDLAGNCSEDLLVPLIRCGKRVLGDAQAIERSVNGNGSLQSAVAVTAAQARTKASLAALDSSHKRLLNPHAYPVGLSTSLHKSRDELISKLKAKS